MEKSRKDRIIDELLSENFTYDELDEIITTGYNLMEQLEE